MFLFFSTHLSISFSFFVHGESTVCTSIDVRQLPPVRTLVKEHLEQTQSGSQSSSQPMQGKNLIYYNFFSFFILQYCQRVYIYIYILGCSDFSPAWYERDIDRTDF